MRRSNRHRSCRQINKFPLFCLFVAALSCAMLYCFIGFINKSNQNNKGSESKDLYSFGDELNLSAELIDIGTNNNILKIDCITPGLDTAEIRTILYSIDEQKKLCEVDLGENLWETGLTDKGFYAVSLTERIIWIYDFNGNEIMKKSLEDISKLWAFAIISGDGNYLLYGDSMTAKVFLYSLSDGVQRKVGNLSGYIASAGFYDGCFYLKSGNGDLMKMAPEDEYLQTAYSDGKINFISPFFGIGTTDNNFFVVSSENGDRASYIEFNSVDEIAIAAGKNGFTSCVSQAKNDLLRVYDIKNQIVSEIIVPETVEKVCYTDDEQLIIAAKNQKNNKYQLYLQSVSSFENEKITVNSDDEVKEPEMPPEIHQSMPELSSDLQSLYIEDVPMIAQFPDFPTGCESVSAVMLLQFAGKDITIDEFVDNCLDKSTDFTNINGLRYGPSPWEYFIGNPRVDGSYGCMSPVIEKALIKCLGSDTSVKNTTGMSLDELCIQYISKDIPVMVWVSINMIETYPSNSWYLQDGSRYSWPANEHCMVLVGCSEDSYYFNDPYSGVVVEFSKELSEQRYGELGKQSIAIIK